MEEQQQEALSLDQKMDLMLKELRALNGRVNPLEESVTDMTTRIVVLEESVSKVVGDAKQVVEEELAAFEAGRVKEEDVSLIPGTSQQNVLPTGYMTGQDRVLTMTNARNGARNRTMNQSMSWQRNPEEEGLEVQQDVKVGEREIHSGPFMQEDKEVRNWETAKVKARNSMFDGVKMWWPTLAEVKAEEFNTINFFEAGLSASQVSWCKSLIYVPDRSVYVHKDDNRKYNETCSKLDDQFRKHAPEFLAEDNVIFFDEYLERFWMAIRRYYMNNHQLCKEILFEKVTGVRAACGYTLKPTDFDNRNLTLKGYLCKMRELFLPPDMKNVCKDAYLSVRQHETDKIDAFFDKILSFWKRAYPNPTEDMFMDFYTQVCNVVLSPTLAGQMRLFSLDLERDGHVRMVTRFRTELITRAQLIVKCLQHNQIAGELARGCTTNQMQLAKTMIKGPGTKDNPINIDQVNEKDTYLHEINQCEPELEEEFEGPDELKPLIGAVQSGMICFFCNKRGHIMRNCFAAQSKKQPDPNGKYFKRYGNKPFVPYKSETNGIKGNVKKTVGEVETEEESKDVSYLNGAGMSSSEDEMIAEVEDWNNALIDEILWYF